MAFQFGTNWSELPQRSQPDIMPDYPRPADFGLSKSVENRFCRFQVGRVEAFGKPVVDRLEEHQGISGTAVVAQEPGKARRGAQVPRPGRLARAPSRALAGSDPRQPPRLLVCPAIEQARP
jgi:hypothetical protein